jgi:uncharacterized membrane protein YbhN (UPF0104 family)
MPEPPRDAPATSIPRRRIPWKRAAAIVVLVAALAFLAWQIAAADPEKIAQRIASADTALVVATLGWTIARFAIAAFRLGGLTLRLVPCRLLPYAPMMMTSQLVGLVIPGIRAGPTVVRAALASRRFGGGMGLHLAPNLFDQALLAVSWLLAGLAMVPLLAWTSDDVLPAQVPLAVVGGLALAGLAYGALRVGGPRLESWLARPGSRRRERIAGFGLATVRGVGELLRDRLALFLGLAGGLAFVVASGVAQHVALLAVGADVPWWLVLVAVALGGTIGGTTGAPGGVGATEAAQIGFLVSQGVPAEEATAGVLLARGLHYAFVFVAGGLGLAYEGATGGLTGLLRRTRALQDEATQDEDVPTDAVPNHAVPDDPASDDAERAPPEIPDRA